MGHTKDVELFLVTRKPECSMNGRLYTSINTLKEVQSEISRYNYIVKINKINFVVGEEVNIEEIKPKKYKGKPYTYQEKLLNKGNK